MQSYPDHRTIEILGIAAQATSHNIGFISYSDLKYPRWLRKRTRIKNILSPIFIGIKIRRMSGCEMIIVREFLTVPLLSAIPILWPIRKKVRLVIAHNLQMAHMRLRDRLALKLLFRLGFRFICLESNAGIAELNISLESKQAFVLPLGIKEGNFVKRMPSGVTGKPVVGIVGHFRPEKGQEAMLQVLEEAIRDGRLDAKVLVGCSDETILRDARDRGFITIDTTTDEAYREAIERSNILVLNFDRERYTYRCSATITDAASAGTAVVCPDYPVFRAQITLPVRVGATFTSPADLPDAVRQAMDVLSAGSAPFEDYVEYRQPANLSRIFEQLMSEEDVA